MRKYFKKKKPQNEKTRLWKHKTANKIVSTDSKWLAIRNRIWCQVGLNEPFLTKADGTVMHPLAAITLHTCWSPFFSDWGICYCGSTLFAETVQRRNKKYYFTSLTMFTCNGGNQFQLHKFWLHRMRIKVQSMQSGLIKYMRIFWVPLEPGSWLGLMWS